MVTMTSTTTFDDIKAKQQQTWSSGDYTKVAWLTVPVAEHLVETVGLRPGSRVLDVATGTGHVAIAAARQFCEVTGIDYVPALLATADRRAAAEGLTVDFREADAERLPFPDGSFDTVLSSIGVMFTADHPRAAGDLVGGRVAGLTFSTATVAQRFPTPDYFADFFLTHYGPTRKAAERLAPDGRRAFRDDLAALAATANHATDGTLAVDWEYLLAVARKPEHPASADRGASTATSRAAHEFPVQST